jgi:hypothetical protein
MLLFSFQAFYITGYVLAPIIAVGFNVGLYLALYAFGVLILYQRFIKKVKLHYLLAYPGEPDEYLPSFTIPRPLIEYVREHPEYFENKGKSEIGLGVLARVQLWYYPCDLEKSIFNICK